ncbi:MAG: hypothetical protein CVV27_20410 [Candidatus Melainabacteria bacterium HGW-Melainabacteria-1]|nr:MAG: hypothetical protein CVV27_20410 [Candidatus Melainabacteria bacterium HGW-Melainabacteria-1]
MYRSMTVKMRIMRTPTMIAYHGLIASNTTVRQSSRKTIIPKQIPEAEPPYAATQRFNGQIYVLIGPETFSSAADLAVTLQDHNFATLIGQETGGLASSYGDFVSYDLGHSRLRAGASARFFVRPNGDRSLQGAKPHVTVAAEIGPSSDPALSKALELIRNRMPN